VTNLVACVQVDRALTERRRSFDRLLVGPASVEVLDYETFMETEPGGTTVYADMLA
jgi:hypothetical protein